MVSDHLRTSYVIFVHERSSSMLYVGWDWMGWMVIIGHRSSKSTFGANKVQLTSNTFHINSNRSKLKGLLLK